LKAQIASLIAVLTDVQSRLSIAEANIQILLNP
jgi:hypothetical protein